jgi:hypothetical protein
MGPLARAPAKRVDAVPESLLPKWRTGQQAAASLGRCRWRHDMGMSKTKCSYSASALSDRLAPCAGTT